MPTATGQAQMGSGIPLCYGVVRATGMRVIDYTVPLLAWQPSTIYNVGDQTSDPKQLYLFTCISAGTSGSSQPDWTHTIGGSTHDGSVVWVNSGYFAATKTYGIWLLGEGEWDGPEILWNQGTLPVQPFRIDIHPWGPNTPDFHFHPGTDTPPGSLIDPTSTGGDQLCDVVFASVPSSTPRLCYSGIAYYAMAWQPENWQGQNANLQPIGDWRTTKCRIFDADGNQVDYKFTTNPAWHWVDAWLRRAIFPRSEYTITPSGPTSLPADAKDKFDWASVYEFAQDCDYLLAGGQKRFEGNYAFSGQTTLAAILETIMLCSRSYQQEYAGKLSIMMDKPRASVFTLTAKHLVPGTFSVDEKSVHQAANEYTANFTDLDLPAVSQVDTIDNVGGAGYDGNDLATFVTVDENPCAQWDIIWYGGCDNPALDYPYYVTEIIDPNTFKAEPLNPLGTASGAGGVIGYPQSKFSKRSARLLHTQHAMARGQIGP